MKLSFIITTSAVFLSNAAIGADLSYQDWYSLRGQEKLITETRPVPPTMKGSVTVIDGRTLMFGTVGNTYKYRLAGIDTCELPQWALDPKWTNRQIQKAPMPVPCGAFAKAWLKRTVANKTTICKGLAYANDGMPVAQCITANKDLAAEMLRVGWARLDSPYINNQYYSYQTKAMSARYGMWRTYVLDMNEWRKRAVDKTLDRHPIADFKLLVNRKSEITPPFKDARSKPRRRDR